ncbi:hypothetical protein, partial [Pseudomonas aeruginosa]|uniref:hypothetical protein n=1 Tax=Pseudomonas aeruginosa TaxID=287 RepID=UPI001C4F6972
MIRIERIWLATEPTRHAQTSYAVFCLKKKIFPFLQALVLAEHLLPVEADNPHGSAVLAPHLAIIALAANHIYLLPCLYCPDHPIAVRLALQHYIVPARSTPTPVSRLL